MAIGLLGVLKAGGAYTPLDPDYPARRLQIILEDSRAPVLLSHGHLLERLPAFRGDVVDPEKERKKIAASPGENPVGRIGPENLVFTLFTSGSTGRPKGVAMPHRALCNLIHWHVDNERLQLPARTLQFTSLNFDVSFQELFSAWCVGGSVTLVSEETRRDATALVDYLYQNRIERLYLPFVALNQLAEAAGRFPDKLFLKDIITAGEQLRTTPGLSRFFERHPECRLHNHYGPTESHVVTSYLLPKDPAHWAMLPPIGRPIANTRIHILGANNDPTPPGVPGELCIAGRSLARGYLDRPELTEKKFIEVELFGRRQRIYKTGDSARWLPDGNLEYLGRLDHQIKFRGFRIELGEIEAVLNRHEMVKDAAVILFDKENNPRLAAYVTLNSPADDPSNSLRAWLKSRLPDYMTPAFFTVLPGLPLTPNGKVDRKSLPAPDPDAQMEQAGRPAPRTETERLLANLWSRVLGVEVAGVDADFFEAGGHSLVATRLASRIRESFGVEMPVRTIFDRATLQEQAEWLDALLAKQSGRTKLPPLTPLPGDEPPVLSFAQQRLWFLARLEGRGATYNMPAVLRLSGALDDTALRRALEMLVRRHDSLRLCFPEVDGKATARKLAPYNPLSITDLGDSRDARRRADALIRGHATEPFDITTGPLLRMHLLKLGEREHLLLFNMHHIISDGWSLGVLVKEWGRLYNAFCRDEEARLPDLPVQYPDYAAWQRDWLSGDILEHQRIYWKEKLADAPGLLELPADFPRPAVMRYRGAHLKTTLSASLTRRLKDRSREESVTLFMTLMAAFNILLHRYSGRTDLVVGTPIANRTLHQTEGVIGFFVNTLALRTRIQDGQTVRELLEQVRRTALEAYGHQDIPFEHLVEQLNPIRSLSHSPLFQVMFAMQNTPIPPLDLADVEVSLLEQEFAISKFDLTLSAQEKDDALICEWEYRTDLFRPETIARMAEHFHILLEGVADHPDRSVTRLPLLTGAETRQLLAWNQTETVFPEDKTIVDLFQEQVEKTPENIAVVFEGRQMTYRELNTRANRLAHYLMTLGVQAETLVGICMERSFSMVIGLLGVLKAGGAYTPLDPEYPGRRLRFMLEDSQAPVLLSQRHLRERLPTSNAKVVCPDDPRERFEDGPGENPPGQSGPENLAYVIYTSGSTGKPKGTLLTHKSLSNYLNWARKEYDPTRGAGAPVQSSIAFDATITSLYLPIISGARIILLNEKEEIESLAELVRSSNRLSLIKITPAHLKILNRQLEKSEYAQSTHALIIGGEALSADTLQPWLTHAPRVRLINEYGPTESVVGCCIHDAMGRTDVSDNVPVGRPIANTRIYVLDVNHNPTPPGVPGELCIAGAGLARGYLNRPGLTAEKFIEVDLFGRRQRIYKTGDSARWLPDGVLEYLGRLDHQIKLRGFRIELGEIEAALKEHELVREAVVVLTNKEENPRLAAYAALTSPAGDATPVLRAWLKKRLPDYMTPAVFMVLSELPLTPNGKVDRNALPEPDSTAFAETFETPRTGVEQRLVEIWSQVLNQTDIGIYDNFFERGGDSILVIQITARARAMGLALSPRDLFRHQTIAELSRAARPLAADNAAARLAEQGPVSGRAKLTPIQKAFFSRRPEEPWHFNQAVLLAVPADMDEKALQQSLAMILRRHDALRMRFRETDAGWEQWHDAPSEEESFHVEELGRLTGERLERTLGERADYWQGSLNLETGPLVRLVLFRAEDQARLLWVIHHLVVDGVSWRILLEDLHAGYRQALKGEPIRPPAKTSSFKAWAERLHAWKKSESFTREADEYWRRLPAAPPLPMDHPTGGNAIADVRNHTISLSRETTRRLLTEAPAAYRTRIDDLLLTALMLTLRDWTGRSRHLIDLENHGRADRFDDIDLSRTVGWFTSLHAISLELPAHSDDPGAALKAVKEQLRRVPHNGVGYGVSRYLNGEAPPRGEILFNYLGQFDQSVQGTGWRFAPEDGGRMGSLKGDREHAVEINGQIVNGRLSLTWSRGGEQYEERTIRRLADAYRRRLHRLMDACASSCGYTPSDFPLADVDQDRLDRLAREYEDNVEDLYPLSPMQEGLLFHSLYAPDSGVYFEQVHFRLTGPMNMEALGGAWRRLVDRHTILRTAIHHDEETPLQVVCKRVTLPRRLLDWRELPEAERRRRLQLLLTSERERGFDLGRAPLMRLHLIRETDSTTRLVLHHHHLIMDGWSLSILLTELFDVYRALGGGRAPSPPPALPYRTYIDWLSRRDRQKAKQYWQGRLQGFRSPTPLPMGPRKGAPDAPADHRTATRTLDARTTRRLQRFGRRNAVTLNTLVQGAWAALLSRYSGESDVVFGVTTSGRQAPVAGMDRMVGLFINTLPLRVRLHPRDAGRDILQDLHAVQRDQQQHLQYAHASLADIQAWSETPGGTALFDTLVVFENYPVDERLLAAPSKRADALRIDEIGAVEYTNYPITLAAAPGERLRFQLAYDATRFQGERMERMLLHLHRLLEGAVARSDRTWHDISLLTEAETRRLRAWNHTDADCPADKTIVDAFQEQVEKTPENVAAVFKDRSLTYRQLNARANRLAHHLTALGVGADTLVGVRVERSLEMVVGLLGVLKAGGAYLPLDPDYPAERLRFMLEDSGATVLLSGGRPVEEAATARVVDVKRERDRIAAYSAENPEKNPGENPGGRGGPGDLAYVIYTSGSTGRPKGVMIEHASLFNHMRWMRDRFGFDHRDKVLQKTPFSFDASVWEFYAPLLSGGALVMAEPGRHMEPGYLIETIRRNGITILQLVPSLLNMLLETPEFQTDLPLRYLFCGGEALADETVRSFHAMHRQCALYNLYGPTEATIDATCWHCEEGDAPVAIGRPIANTRAYVLDGGRNPTPPGLPGELCIAGAALARGYLHRPELTREKFIEVDLPGRRERVYKTGDLVRRRPDGALEYLGRMDHQIKLRGFRIELGEIETALRRHDRVREAAVVLLETENDPRLFAFVALHSPVDDAARVLRAWLRSRLPEYMIPAGFTVLPRLPLTPNGKIDRRALPEPSPEPSPEPFPEPSAGPDRATPGTEAERKIARVWRRVLQRERVGIHDNFFDLGGHSLRMIRVHNRLRALFGPSLSMVELFQYPTVAALAKHLTRGEKRIAPPVSAVRSEEGEEIAIIGMAGRFPGAGDVDAFWRNIRDGVESITFFSDEELLAEGESPDRLNHPDYVKAGGVLEGIELFDANFFGCPPREVELMDPQHRLFLECVVEALENAGCAPDRFDGAIGVYAGCGAGGYLLRNIASHPGIMESMGDHQLMIGNTPDHLATRASYKLDLKGPAVTVQTACSTSLAAVHAACRSLLGHECDMALAGGVGVSVPQKRGYLYEPGMIASPDGHCRAFDADADGTVGGAGVGVVALKRLERALAEGDHVYAVIKRSAINNDGRGKVGYTAPGVEGQASVIADAMRNIDPESVGYIETHGTGTPMGDPVEIAALTRAYRTHTRKKGFCAIGSVKTNIGHLDAAAGVAGLIKTALALTHGQLPPSLHFQRPNPEIDFAGSPFYVNTELADWEKSGGAPRRAGVSSFGMGGSNVHVVLEEAPEANRPAPEFPSTWQLLPLSARTPTALERATANLADFLKRRPGVDLGDVAYTLAEGRTAFEHRRVLVCRSAEDAAEALGALTPGRVWTRGGADGARSAAFLFSGRGAAPVAGTRALYRREPVFREEIDRCADILKKRLYLDLHEALAPSPGNAEEAARALARPAMARSALFAAEYALARLWMAWGVRPAALAGRGVGRYAAAHLEGALSLEEALALAADETERPAADPSRPARVDDRAPEWLADPGCLLLEIGPERTWTAGPSHPSDQGGKPETFYSLDPRKDPSEAVPFLLGALGKLWLAGVSIDWSGFHAGKGRRRLSLPTYPFERRRYWIEPRTTDVPATRPGPDPTPGKKKPDIADWFYLPGWKSSAPVALGTADETPASTSWLVFIDACGLGARLVDELEQSGRDVVVVKTGDAFTRASNKEYVLNPGKREDYEALLQALHTLHKPLRSIVHLWTVTPDDDKTPEIEAVEKAQIPGFYSLLFLTQALGGQMVSDEFRLMVVSNHLHTVTGDDVLRPEKAAVLGPVNVIGREYPNISCRSIDVVIPSSSKDMEQKLIAPLLNELTSPSTDRVVAYRGGRRWTPSFEPVRLNEPAVNASALRENGTYLITGGLGGIGLSLAEHLAGLTRARLILVGRSPFPERDRWDDWLAANADEPEGIGDGISDKIRKLRAMEAKGAEVWVARADVADRRRMREVIAKAKRRYGRIHGVIHCAGVPGGGVIQGKTPETAAGVLAPKVRGAVILHMALKDEPLDFMVFCSSLASVLEEFGQVDYCAANAFLDAYAHHLASRGVRAVSIGWDAWRDVGMAADAEAPPGLREEWAKSLREEGISPREGREAFHRVINSPLTHVLASTREFTRRIERSRAFAPRLEERAMEEKIHSSNPAHPRPDLTNPYVKPGAPLERTLTDIWQTLLGVGPIGIHDDFFELGGDSMSGARVVAHIRERCGVGLPMHILFETPTIAGVAGAMAGTDGPGSDSPGEAESNYVEGEL